MPLDVGFIYPGRAFGVLLPGDLFRLDPLDAAFPDRNGAVPDGHRHGIAVLGNRPFEHGAVLHVHDVRGDKRARGKDGRECKSETKHDITQSNGKNPPERHSFYAVHHRMQQKVKPCGWCGCAARIALLGWRSRHWLRMKHRRACSRRLTTPGCCQREYLRNCPGAPCGPAGNGDAARIRTGTRDRRASGNRQPAFATG
jgi:hypothetical protein